MPVSTPTTVRIPMPAETTGSGLAAMLSSARGNAQAKAPAAPASAPATSEQVPSGVTAPAVAPSQRPMRTDGPAPQDDFRSPGPAKRAPQADKTSNQPNHNDPNLAANGKFTINEKGQVVPVGERPPDDTKRAPDPDEVDFTEDDKPAEPEAKVEAKTEAPAEVKPAEPAEPAEPLAFTQTARDYSLFDPADVDALKKLHNGPFNRLQERFVQAKKDREELETLRKEVSSKPKEPVYLYEHPEAFMLQPEFTNLLTQEDNSTQLVNFYQTQLAKASEGEDIQVLNQQGQLQDIKLNGRVNGQVLAYLQVELNRYVQQQQQAKLATQQYQTRYKQQVATVAQQLKQIDDRLFPGFSVDKLSPEEKALYEEAYRITPEPLRGSPQTKHLAQAFVSYAQLHARTSAEIADLKKQIAALTAKAPTVPKPIPAGQGSVEDFAPFSVDD